MTKTSPAIVKGSWKVMQFSLTQQEEFERVADTFEIESIYWTGAMTENKFCKVSKKEKGEEEDNDKFLSFPHISQYMVRSRIIKYL